MPSSTNIKFLSWLGRWRKGTKKETSPSDQHYSPVSGNEENHPDSERQIGNMDDKEMKKSEMTQDTEVDIRDDDEEKRATWGSGVDFILSTMGYAIGLGNVWRFPYLCYENGGGAFLFPYFIMLFIVCFPIMFMEMGLGQFSSLGCITVWRISPLFKGIGYAMALVSAYFCFYYIIIIAYSIFYMFATMQSELPWKGCNHTWNTPDCYDGSDDVTTPSPDNTTLPTYLTSIGYNLTTILPNMTTPVAAKKVWATEEFWKYFVLDQTDGLHDLGTVRWQLLLCFLATWLIVYLCIIKGVKTSGKVVYFTATFPFLVLFVLLVRGLTLDGAIDGVLYFIRPRFDKLLEAKVWLSAANQVFLSYGAGWGGVLTLASYNKFHKHCLRDALIIVVSGSFTSILAGFVIFSVLGFMAKDANVDIEDVVSSGPGLAFVAYPEALSRLPLPQLWAFLFFFMLLTLGLDSEFVTLETVITAMVDEFKEDYPILHRRRYLVILLTCIVMLLIGLPLTTQGGIYIFELFNWYSAGFTPMLITIFESMAISYVYGGPRFIKDLESMFGWVPIRYWWYVNWYTIVPGMILIVMVVGFVDYTPAYYDDYVFPPWGQAIGWTLTMSSISMIFFYMIYAIIKQRKGSIIERIRAASRPTANWGPGLDENRLKAGYPLLAEVADSKPPIEDSKL